MQTSSNFNFLAEDNHQLADLGRLAERYFHDDPSTCIVKLRQFAELTAKTIAAYHAAYRGERETFEDILKRLSYDRIVPREVADIFHALRKAGNAAVHEMLGGHNEALTALKFARSLGVWFHRTYGRQPNFNPGAFLTPANFQNELDELLREVAETKDAIALARREAEDHARARETVEERLRREAEERAAWEQLAEEAEAEKLSIAAKLANVSREDGPRLLGMIRLNSELLEPADRAKDAEAIEDEKAAIAAKLASLQIEAEAAPRAEVIELIERGEEAAAKIDLDEAETRALIDQQLRDRGWQADTKALRYSMGVRPAKGRSMSIAEWPTANGPATMRCSSTQPSLVSSKQSASARTSRRPSTRLSVTLPGSATAVTTQWPVGHGANIGALRLCRQWSVLS